MKKFGRFYVNMGDFRHIWRKITKKMEFLLLRCVIGATHRCEIFKIWSCGMSLVPHTPCEIFKVSDVVWHGSHIKICHNHSHWSVVWVSFRYLLCHTILYFYLHNMKHLIGYTKETSANQKYLAIPEVFDDWTAIKHCFV